jgi:hypothetical protein
MHNQHLWELIDLQLLSRQAMLLSLATIPFIPRLKLLALGVKTEAVIDIYAFPLSSVLLILDACLGLLVFVKVVHVLFKLVFLVCSFLPYQLYPERAFSSV